MKTNKQLLNKEGQQIAGYPSAYMRITQGVNDPYSHAGTNCWDEGDSNKSGHPQVAIASAKLVVKQVKNDGFNTVIVWTAEPVWTAKYGFTHFSWLLKHSNDVSHLTPGMVIDQGEPFYKEGRAGPKGPKQYPSHIHHSVAIGHTLKLGPRGIGLANDVPPYDVFFTNDTVVMDSLGYPFKEYVDNVEMYFPGDRVKIIGNLYATGQKVPAWVKLRTFTISRIYNRKALLKEIKSWVYIRDIKMVTPIKPAISQATVVKK